jgi:hypothetical protein
MTTKPWLHLASATVIIIAGVMVVRLREMLRIRIPVGYQDESGFHFGSEKTES